MWKNGGHHPQSASLCALVFLYTAGEVLCVLVGFPVDSRAQQTNLHYAHIVSHYFKLVERNAF